MDYKESQVIRDIARTILNPVNNAPQACQGFCVVKPQSFGSILSEQLDDTIPEILE